MTQCMYSESLKQSRFVAIHRHSPLTSSAAAYGQNMVHLTNTHVIKKSSYSQPLDVVLGTSTLGKPTEKRPSKAAEEWPLLGEMTDNEA